MNHESHTDMLRSRPITEYACRVILADHRGSIVLLNPVDVQRWSNDGSGHGNFESVALNMLRFDDDLTGRHICVKLSEV